MATTAQDYKARRITHVELHNTATGKDCTARIIRSCGLQGLEAILEDGTPVVMAPDGDWFIPNSSPSPDSEDVGFIETKSWQAGDDKAAL